MRVLALVVALAIASLPDVAAAARAAYECEPEMPASLPDDELMSWGSAAGGSRPLIPSTNCADDRLGTVYASAVGSCDLPAVPASLAPVRSRQPVRGPLTCEAGSCFPIDP